MLVAVGVLLVTGVWNDIVVELQVWATASSRRSDVVDQTLTSAPSRGPSAGAAAAGAAAARAGPVGLAPAHLDAHRAGAAVPARAGRRARLAGAAAQHRPGPGRAVRRAAPARSRRGTTGSSLFDVFSSPWFAAIYLLLFVSLVGCVLPRSRRTWRRAAPGRRARRATSAGCRCTRRRPTRRGTGRGARPRPARCCAARRFRVDVGRRRASSAEKGYLRETGNLVFHLALLLPAARRWRSGTCSATRATCSLVEGDGVLQHRVGLRHAGRRARWLDETTLRAVHGDARRPRRCATSRAGSSAARRATSRPRSATRRARTRRTKRTTCGSTTRWRSTAPRCSCSATATRRSFTVRDSNGEVVSRGPVPFLPRDGNNTSIGVVKVPGAHAAAARLRRASSCRPR